MMFLTSPEMNDTSAAPARSGLTAATGPEPGVAAGAIVFGEQPRVALGGRERRVAVLEGQRRLGLGQRAVGQDRLHRVARVLQLFLRQRPQVAHRQRRRGNHVGLAGGRAAAEDLVHLGGRAAEHQARVEREVLFAGQLPPEAVEDAARARSWRRSRARGGRSATSARSSPSLAASRKTCRGVPSPRSADRLGRPRSPGRTARLWPPRPARRAPRPADRPNPPRRRS